MPSFDDILVSESEKFLRLFGEPVLLIAPSGEEREVLAVVERNPISPMPNEMGTSCTIEAEMMNDNQKGLAASEFDSNQWQIKLPVRVGGSKQIRTISHIIAQDAGMIRVGIR
ncbi:MAG TPA: hypothetical protein PKY88_12780 [Anaerohalosphaeraceae bacterium]|nr:hypothetical protein [Anaerohalosphaeraceae bacterium]